METPVVTQLTRFQTYVNSDTNLFFDHKYYDTFNSRFPGNNVYNEVTLYFHS